MSSEADHGAGNVGHGRMQQVELCKVHPSRLLAALAALAVLAALVASHIGIAAHSFRLSCVRSSILAICVLAKHTRRSASSPRVPWCPFELALSGVYSSRARSEAL